MAFDNSNEAEEAASLLALARQTHEAHVAAAKKKADEIIASAQAEADELLSGARKEYEWLQGEIEKLRDFEVRYREALKDYLKQLLEEISTDDDYETEAPAAPLVVPSLGEVEPEAAAPIAPEEEAEAPSAPSVEFPEVPSFLDSGVGDSVEETTTFDGSLSAENFDKEVNEEKAPTNEFSFAEGEPPVPSAPQPIVPPVPEESTYLAPAISEEPTTDLSDALETVVAEDTPQEDEGAPEPTPSFEDWSTSLRKN